MAYTSASAVEILTTNLLGASGSYDANTKPTLTAINFWLSSGCSHIEGALKSAGYATPIAAGNVLYDRVAGIEALYATAMAEMSRSNVRLGPGERTRGQVFLEEFKDQLEDLVKKDLTQAGVGILGLSKMYAGGISSADKTLVEDDSDRVTPRFARDLFRHPGAGTVERQERDDD